jgi:hypothetical protein
MRQMGDNVAPLPVVGVSLLGVLALLGVLRRTGCWRLGGFGGFFLQLASFNIMPARSLGRAEPALLPSCFICGGGRQQVKVMGCSKYKNKKKNWRESKRKTKKKQEIN